MLGLLAKRCGVISFKKLISVLKMKFSSQQWHQCIISRFILTQELLSHDTGAQGEPSPLSVTPIHIHCNLGHASSSCNIFQFNTSTPLWKKLSSLNLYSGGSNWNVFYGVLANRNKVKLSLLATPRSMLISSNCKNKYFYHWITSGFFFFLKFSSFG